MKTKFRETSLGKERLRKGKSKKEVECHLGQGRRSNRGLQRSWEVQQRTRQSLHCQSRVSSKKSASQRIRTDL